MASQRTAPDKKRRKIRLVCISDTHNHATGEGYTLPKGDVLIHAGDLTVRGSKAELEKAARWLEKADFATKIVVAGNHDLSLDRNYGLKHEEGWKVAAEDFEQCRAVIEGIPGVTYLEHSFTEIQVPGFDIPLRMFGSPFSAESPKQNWAFQYPDGDADSIWASIPSGIDILITHTPPLGHVDTSKHWQEGGCPSLAQSLRRIRPALHICGHCHEGRGAEIIRWSNDPKHSKESVETWSDPGVGNKKQSLLDLTRIDRVPGKDGYTTAVVNASIMAKSWGQGSKAFNKPIVVDMLVPVRDE